MQPVKHATFSITSGSETSASGTLVSGTLVSGTSAGGSVVERWLGERAHRFTRPEQATAKGRCTIVTLPRSVNEKKLGHKNADGPFLSQGAITLPSTTVNR